MLLTMLTNFQSTIQCLPSMTIAAKQILPSDMTENHRHAPATLADLQSRDFFNALRTVPVPKTCTFALCLDEFDIISVIPLLESCVRHGCLLCNPHTKRAAHRAIAMSSIKRFR